MHNLVSLLIVVAASCVVLVTGIVLWFYAYHQMKGSRRTLKLELRNDGNVPGRYELNAEDPTGSLHFQWGLNGLPLGTRQVPQAVNAPQLPAPPSNPAKPASDGGLRRAAATPKIASGAVAELLMTIGNMLPLSIGRPLINLGSQLRVGQYTAQRVSNLPGQLTRMNPMGAMGPVYAVGSGQPALVSIGGPSAVGNVRTGAAVMFTGAWAQTPAVPPGGALILDLTTEPARAQHFQLYTFRVTSRSIEQPDLLVTENGSVSIAGISTLRSLLPLIIFVAVALLTVACTAFLLSSPRIVGG